MDRKDIAIIVGLFSVSFLIRYLGVANTCMYPDEWIYYTDMHRILSVSFAPIRPDIFNYTSPFFSYIGAASTPLFGNDLDTVRVLSVLFGSLTVPFLYLFGKEMYDRKVGFLAAVLLAFSAYHSLYSRIIMLEAFSIFFITAFLYFFWRMQRQGEERGLLYPVLAGAMMGLAVDAKYISLFLVPAVAGYVLWTTKFDIKALFERRIVVMFVSAFIFVLPLLICLFSTGVGFHGLLYYSMEKYEKPGAQSRLSSLPINEIVQRGTDTITGVFAWGSDKLIPPAEIAFNVAVVLLILVTIIWYLFRVVRREREATFLVISVAILHVLLFVVSPYKHYYNYTLPFYYLMISFFVLQAVRKKGWIRDPVALCIALLALIVIAATLFTGITSPMWDRGEYSGVDDIVGYLKNDAYSSGLHDSILIGTTFREVVAEYSVRNHDFSAASTRIIELTGPFEKNKYKTDLDKIEQYQPNYLIFTELSYGRFYFNKEVQDRLLRDYRIIRDYKEYFLEYIVLKREAPIARNETASYEPGQGGEINAELFRESIPGEMKVGTPYPARVDIKNTGSVRTTYYLALGSDKFVIFTDKPVRSMITLDPGETGTLVYNLVPYRAYPEELPVEAEIYTIPENVTPEQAEDPQAENWARQKMDLVVDSVYRITL